jgi:hypothetical protein
MRKKKLNTKVNEEVCSMNWDDVLVWVAPYLNVFSLLALRGVNKKLFCVFSRNKMRESLGLRREEPPLDAIVTRDTCFLFFVEFWDLFDLKKTVHETPLRKAITGVTQGAIRMIQYSGDLRNGDLLVTCMPSVKWAKKKRQRQKVQTDVDNPYRVTSRILDGRAGDLTCSCPVG